MSRSTLTRGQIIDSAIGLLDEDGLDGLNMRALGNRLGFRADRRGYAPAIGELATN